MIARGFKSVLWVGAVGSAALGCYMVSLRVATERADLAKVEHKIVEAKRDIRTLQTELGTRGRLTQLEDWNANVLALSAPTTSQFVKDGYALAQLQTREPNVADRTGEVRMAALETGAAAPDAKPVPAANPAPVAVEKPARAVPAPQAEPVTPRIVRAVAAAPAPHEAPLVRRAAFIPSAPVETVPAPKRDATKPAKPQQAAAPAHIASAKPQPAATPAHIASAKPARPQPAAAPARVALAKPDPAKKAKPADTIVPAKHDAHPALRTAAADKPQPATRPAKTAKAVPAAHAPTRLAGAEPAAHASGHHGGAQ